MKRPVEREQSFVPVRREGPEEIAVHIAMTKVIMAPWIARQLAGALLRAAARIDPDFRSKP